MFVPFRGSDLTQKELSSCLPEWLPAGPAVVSPGSLTAAQRVLLVDAVGVFRKGLRLSMGACSHMKVIGEAATGAEALRWARDATLVVMDIDLPDRAGIDVCRQLVRRRPEMLVILLSYWDWDIYLAGAMRAGASGFVSKRAPAAELLEAISLAPLCPAFTAEQLLRAERWEAMVAAPLRSLAPRERDIVWLLAAGKSNRDIAETLHLAAHTVDGYASSVLHKLGMHSSAGLLAYVLQHHLSEHRLNWLD
jgi:DNA-binding NarL/FixJ family response regulator